MLVYLILFIHKCVHTYNPDGKIHGANMGPIWGRQDPGGPHVGPHELCYLGYSFGTNSIMTDFI